MEAPEALSREDQGEEERGHRPPRRSLRAGPPVPSQGRALLWVLQHALSRPASHRCVDELYTGSSWEGLKSRGAQTLDSEAQCPLQPPRDAGPSASGMSNSATLWTVTPPGSAVHGTLQARVLE